MEEEFSLPLFFTVVALSLGGTLALLCLLAPHAVWHAQVGGPFWKGVTAFQGLSLFNCFMEFFFHRYGLHKPVMKMLSYFYRQHTHHHSLTRITPPRPGSEICLSVHAFRARTESLSAYQKERIAVTAYPQSR